MLGDTAVACTRTTTPQALIGKMVKHPWSPGATIPIIADADAGRPEFGTGAVKVTPAHDPNDFESGQRHKLPIISILDTRTARSTRTPASSPAWTASRRARRGEGARGAGPERGRAARPRVGHCQRCNTVVEPLISTQWFVKMQPLAEPAIEAVERGKTRFVPESWAKTYFHWMRNIRDWCISRQLWWGHRIPAWYCGACGHITVARERPRSAPLRRHELRQDEDVLDTWFSSGLWPFATLGWPDETRELRTFYPTTCWRPATTSSSSGWPA